MEVFFGGDSSAWSWHFVASPNSRLARYPQESSGSSLTTHHVLIAARLLLPIDPDGCAQLKIAHELYSSIASSRLKFISNHNGTLTIHTPHAVQRRPQPTPSILPTPLNRRPKSGQQHTKCYCIVLAGRWRRRPRWLFFTQTLAIGWDRLVRTQLPLRDRLQ